jgi:hypothetical protein
MALDGSMVALAPWPVKRSIGALRHIGPVMSITGSWCSGPGVDGQAARPAQLDLVARLGVAVAHRRLGPSSSATTSTTERALPSSAVQARCCSPPTTTTRLPS